MEADEIFAQEIRELIADDALVPVVGAGVSAATCNLPGWATLLESGLTHLRGRRLVSESLANEIRGNLHSNNFLLAARKIQNAFEYNQFEIGSWLRKQLDDTTCEHAHSNLIYCILDLPCKLVATTNYDRLLERFDAQKRSSIIQADRLDFEGLQNRGSFSISMGLSTDHPLSYSAERIMLIWQIMLHTKRR